MTYSDNILILTHWSFKDALIQTYTLPYLNIIRDILPEDKKIILVTSEQKSIALTPGETAEINKNWSPKNMMLLPQPYHQMGLKKMIAVVNDLSRLYKLIKKEKILIIHSFCTPAGAFGYLLSKLSRTRLIIDSYEPHAEAMVENGTWNKGGLAFRLLFLFEKLQSQAGECFISTASGMKHYAKQKFGVNIKRFFLKPACVDLNKFSLAQKDEKLLQDLKLHDKIVCVYAGKLGGIYLNEEVFDFIKECYNYWGDRFRFLLLTNTSEEEVIQQLERVNIPKDIIVQRFVTHKDIAAYLRLGDFAINPVKPVPTKRYCTSIKDGEYWATGLPVVITKNISDDSDIIKKNQIGYVLESLNQSEYRNAISRIEELINSPQDILKNKIRNVAEKYRSFEIAKKIYNEIYY